MPDGTLTQKIELQELEEPLQKIRQIQRVSQPCASPSRRVFRIARKLS